MAVDYGPLEQRLRDTLAPVQGSLAIELASIDVSLFRVPLDFPINTVFGPMYSRPAIFLRAIDKDGAEGIGEVWCNFPVCGAEHRARLAADILPGLLVGPRFRNPPAVHDALERKLHTLSIQAGEPGPIAQILGGLDVALWDLVARRQGCPFYALFGGIGTVPVYASSIPPQNPVLVAMDAQARGYGAFKLRVGFGDNTDLCNLRDLREALGDSARLMVDANQSWTVDQSIRMAQRMRDIRVDWLEEPIAADGSLADWRRISQAGGVPLAGGENIRGLYTFESLVQNAGVQVLQPDVGKWGGISGGLHVAGTARAAGLRFCPHWLGGGVGLAASLQLQAALGSLDYVEVDANPNPLRQMMIDLPVSGGCVSLPDSPGLGVSMDLAALERFRV